MSWAPHHVLPVKSFARYLPLLAVTFVAFSSASPISRYRLQFPLQVGNAELPQDIDELNPLEYYNAIDGYDVDETLDSLSNQGSKNEVIEDLNTQVKEELNTQVKEDLDTNIKEDVNTNAKEVKEDINTKDKKPAPLSTKHDVNNPSFVKASDHSVQFDQSPLIKGNSHAPHGMSSFTFIVIVSACAAVAVFGIVGAGFCFYRLQKNSKAAADTEYPAYGVTGPNKGDNTSPSGDRKLAQSAQMYHYQHQKQQMIALEKAGTDRNQSASDVDSEEENEEGDYTVYECPGLAPTGEMEVKNPLFNEQPTPTSPSVKKNNYNENESSLPEKESTKM